MIARCLAALAAATLLVTAAAQAQSWPTRPVRLIVPFAPGGNTDAIARLAGENLGSAFGQPFIVDNRPGASGAIAAEFVARSTPDGYTYCVCTLSQMAPVPLTQKVGYDPLKDLVAVANIGANPFVIAVATSVPVSTLKEFVDHVRARPNALNYGSGGTGNLTHLVGALFLDRAKLQMTHVPYKGGAPALADLLGGQIQMYAASPSEVIAFAKAGKVRLLAISSEARSAQLPDVPTVAETFPKFRAVTWNGLLAPAGVAPAILDRINAQMLKAMKDPVFLDRLGRIGVDPVPTTRAEFAAEIRADYVLWRDLIKATGITVQ
ncbi:MAG: tripartite tricarboxylate transporter substrate binding protein [Proteobacteria bacterium]|nr:tripartite tricarboxylate transporter substrate binding protein [Pseudomonadota bacterium]